VVDDRIWQEMMAYYDARAPEYDELYSGAGREISDLQVYKKEVENVGTIVARFSRGHLLDVGCGTGYWLARYAEKCSAITLIDQSAGMLSECAQRVKLLGIAQKCRLIQGDFLKMRTSSVSADTVLVGFVISHLTVVQEKLLFERIKQTINDSAYLVLLDSAWTPKRQQFREKESVQERVLNDGRTFRVYKRYFTQSDVERMYVQHGFRLECFYIGDLILAAAGRLRHNRNGPRKPTTDGGKE
jgi:SAM-dependent methyltransferase